MFRLATKPIASPLLRASQRRTIITLKDVKYTANATASGAGRNGHVESKDPALSLDLALPKTLGGTGKGHNPEELFAAGYAACFLSAIHASAKQLGKKSDGAVVNASVHIGTPSDSPGFGLAVDLKVSGIDDELLQAAHKMCPYSRAVSEGIQVKVSTA